MENFFSLDGKFFRFINKFTSLIALNFLFIITSLPYNRGILLRPLSNKFKTFTKYRILYCKNLFFLLEKKFKAEYSSLATCNDFIYILSD